MLCKLMNFVLNRYELRARDEKYSKTWVEGHLIDKKSPRKIVGDQNPTHWRSKAEFVSKSYETNYFLRSVGDDRHSRQAAASFGWSQGKKWGSNLPSVVFSPVFLLCTL